jgi:hypothetical protein
MRLSDDMKHEKFAVIGAFLLLLCSACFAIPAGVQVSVSAPAGFGDGETVYFDYTLTSATGGRVSFVPIIACDGNPVAPLLEMNATLNASEPYIGRYSDFAVGELTKPGNCAASILVLDNGKPTEARASASFAINTLPVLETRFFTCADEKCANPKKVFVKGEKVYIHGTAKNGEPITIESKDANFGNGMAMASIEPGYHGISVSSRSPSYKNAPVEKVQYAVIPRHPRILLKNFNVKENDPASIKDTVAISTESMIDVKAVK